MRLDLHDQRFLGLALFFAIMEIVALKRLSFCDVSQEKSVMLGPTLLDPTSKSLPRSNFGVIARHGNIIKNDSHAYLHTIYHPWNRNQSDLCFPDVAKWFHPAIQRSPTREGILFVRNMKTGSSTVGGIAIRIARSIANKTTGLQWETAVPMCKVRFDHAPAYAMEYDLRNKRGSFLFSFVRDPTKRIVSEFFHFSVSREQIEPSDENFKRYILGSNHTDNYLVRDMALSPITAPEWKEPIRKILGGYNFIGVTERMHESLVVLKMLLKLDFRDILYLSSKGNGGYDDGASSSGCVYIVPSFVSSGMKEFFSSQKWKKRIAGDDMLYNAAIRSLEATINSLGRGEVERQVEVFRKALKKAESTCLSRTRFPCSSTGDRQKYHSCYTWDLGCGHECFDNLDLGEFGVADLD